MKQSLPAGPATLAGGALAQAFDFKANQRYPDPAVQILDPNLAKYRIYSSTLEQVATGRAALHQTATLPGVLAAAVVD